MSRETQADGKTNGSRRLTGGRIHPGDIGPDGRDYRSSLTAR